MPSPRKCAVLYEKAKSSVDFALHKLEDVWNVEDALLSGATSLSEAYQLMGSVKTMLVQIQHALVNAELNWNETDSSVEEWVMSVQGVALQVETTILNFLSKVGRSIDGLPDAVKRISTKPVDLFSLHKLGNEMSRIKSALQDISTHVVMRSLDVTGSAARRIPEQAGHYELGLVGYEVLHKSIIEKLLDQSTHPERLQVAITGPPGAGKTTLAQEIYCNIKVKRHFDVCFWLFETSHIESSCPEQFEPIDVLKKMLAKAEPENHSLDNNEETEIIGRLGESLKKKRYLVIVENILRYNEFIKKALPDEKNGSRVLIVNREIGYYGRVFFGLNPAIIYELTPLSEEENLQLMLGKSHHELKNFQPDTLQMEIATRWGHVPMNLFLLGAHLQFNPSVLNDTQVLRDMDATAMSSGIIFSLYNYLPSVLKRCFSCIAAVFPISYIIPVESVIQLWIAEGIILNDNGITMEVTAQIYLDELVQRGFMRAIWAYYHNEANQPTRVVVLDPQLHDNFKYYTHMNNPLFVDITGTLMMALSLSKTSTNTLLDPDLFIEDACDGDPNNDPVSFHPVRRLAVHLPSQFNRTSFEEGNVIQGFKYPKLHSLFFFGSVAPLMFSQFSFLRVLAVYQARIWFSEEDRECWLDGLLNLRYLAFIVCWIEAGSFGKKLTRLRNLKTLDLSKSFISGLSEFIEGNTTVNVMGPVSEEFGRWWSPLIDEVLPGAQCSQNFIRIYLNSDHQ